MVYERFNFGVNIVCQEKRLVVEVNFYMAIWKDQDDKP